MNVQDGIYSNTLQVGASAHEEYTDKKLLDIPIGNAPVGHLDHALYIVMFICHKGTVSLLLEAEPGSRHNMKSTVCKGTFWGLA
jgi:hypothetical protein